MRVYAADSLHYRHVCHLKEAPVLAGQVELGGLVSGGVGVEESGEVDDGDVDAAVGDDGVCAGLWPDVPLRDVTARRRESLNVGHRERTHRELHVHSRLLFLQSFRVRLDCLVFAVESSLYYVRMREKSGSSN